ncbi:MAG: ComF family protein [Thermoguttaceae bacterium]|nr:ComF family protein [Thermoguttaceae bacterium]
METETGTETNGKRRAFRRVVETAFELVYPRTCWICDERIIGAQASGGRSGVGVSSGFRVPLAALVCEECRRAASVPARTFCRRCGRVALRETARGDDALCRRCLRRSGASEFAFDEVRPLHFYRGTTRALVLQLKRTADPTLAEIAARLYFASRRRALTAFRPDAVVPVPMNWRRRFLRSVNSPDFLASALARELGVPCWAKTVRRVRATPPQSSVDWAARRDNVAGAFALSGGKKDGPVERLKGKRILLVDDAFTSGATANEIASTLKDNAEVEAVCVATLARAGLGKGRRL